MTTPFLEAPRFPDDLGFWATGGATYNTIVTGSTSGREQRNVLWQFSRGQWDLQGVYRTNGVAGAPYAIQTLRNFFHTMKGQAYGFRFRDWTDYQDEGAGIMGLPVTSYRAPLTPTGHGSGVQTYQLFKAYIASPLADYRIVQKPYPSGVALFRGGVAVPATGAGAATLDTTTGLVTFVADSSAAITGITSSGSSTILTIGSPIVGWSSGKLLYVSGVSGDTNSVFNGHAWGVTAISGTSVTLNANTAGLTLAGGVLGLYPQNTESLTWTGMFDLPCRFATDSFAPNMEADGLYTLQSLGITEIRL